MIFVDTGIWFALLVPDDQDHQRVSGWFRTNREPLVTTDFVVDEVLTLLRARGQGGRALAAGTAFFDQTLARLYHVNEAAVLAGWDVYQRFGDKEWSFTDCVSYATIEALEIRAAASLDHHFRQFGIVSVHP